jgi:hypothetical protein
MENYTTQAKRTHVTLGNQNERYSQLEKLLGSFSGDLDFPLCAICSTQTTWEQKNISLEAEDTDYKCKICQDPRQYIGRNGQKWTTLRSMLEDNEKKYRNVFEELIPGELWAFRTQPAFGIGQRAFLIKDPAVEGLVMWDCVAYLDDATLAKIDELSHGKGIRHLVISHCHYYSTSTIWTATFPQMEIWLQRKDFFDWYQREDIVDAARSQDSNHTVVTRIRWVTREQTFVSEGAPFTILLLGGHFPGSLVLLWRDILLVADTIQVIQSGLYKSSEAQRPGITSVSFMWRCAYRAMFTEAATLISHPAIQIRSPLVPQKSQEFASH